ncbi:MAG: hypothetical protein EAX96_14470 [Candidatus Lokiarchaeota archaeon]|nr:hypothetical protein [Candidatus Lokiarchaeota archaeon]
MLKNVTVELIFTGNELLNGRILNTNSRYLCKKISNLGASVIRIITVPDDLELISYNIKNSINNIPSILIISGGMGTSFDDMTLEAVSNAIKKPLLMNEKALEYIKINYEFLKKIKLLKDFKLDDYKKKMATLPEGSIPLYNAMGAAPGIMLECKTPQNAETLILCLPGVPSELKSLFRTHIVRIIKEKVGGNKYIKESFFVEGFIESEITFLSEKIMSEFNNEIWIKTFVKSPHIRKAIEFEVSSRGLEIPTKEKVKNTIRRLKEEIKKRNGKIL